MKVTLMLADSAQAVGGKLYILGGGWSLTGPEPASFALAGKIEVPWDQAGFSHTFRLALFDSDGQVRDPTVRAQLETLGSEVVRVAQRFAADGSLHRLSECDRAAERVATAA